ncbi:MAG: TetR/AcrR family transcriptional regulator [Gammaproteobacteria bacterium]|nr:TetR/AcrR family transcriptional regulator [Gammaproteobacteria bacterium]
MLIQKSAPPASEGKQPARERILLTAHDLFYREGIRGTGIDRIIAESGVTKVTFYRHYPSKNALIEAYLDYRHGQWMDWFQDALRRHGDGVEAIVPALREWFAKPDFRGCAFINTMGEMGTALPETVQWLQRHKAKIRKLIENLLPAGAGRKSTADAIALGIDGAVVRAASGEVVPALRGLSLLIVCLDRAYHDRQKE